jgi:hypothetical protein
MSERIALRVTPEQKERLLEAARRLKLETGEEVKIADILREFIEGLPLPSSQNK